MTDVGSQERRYPTRREFVAMGIGAFVIAVSPLGLLRRRTLVRRAVPVMGTTAEFAVVHGSARVAHAAIDAAVAELRRVDQTMTRFNPDSDVGRANRLASARPVTVSGETAHVLELALNWARASDGAFDPCLGRAVELWDIGNRREPPEAERIDGLAGRRLYQALEIESGSAHRLRFHAEDTALDLGGIAKGYGVDRAVDALRAFGVYHGLVSVGGDLYAMGYSQDGDPWRVGIRDPDDPAALIETIPLSDAAVATSGDYIQFFEHGGRRYHHLLNPTTGEPRRSKMRSITVVAGDCVSADAAATAAFGLPLGDAERILRHADSDARVVRVL